MSCEHLVCASCAHPVAEGRCPVCRQSREQLHGHGMSPTAALAIGMALLVLALLLAQHYS